jgi:hypothetical protein
MMAVTQIRYPYTDGRRSCERKRAEGKTREEALRCLKRCLDRLSRAVVISARARQAHMVAGRREHRRGRRSMRPWQVTRRLGLTFPDPRPLPV